MIQQIIYASPHNANSLQFFFHYEQTNARTEFLPHTHSWGQAIFVHCKLLEIRVDNERLMTPTGMPIWIPPGVKHASYNHEQAHFRTLNIAASLCAALPAQACLLKVSPIVQAIIDDFAAREVEVPDTPADWRLCDVLMDQLLCAEVQNSYLPMSDDKILAPVLTALEQNPADNTTLAQWATLVYTTERTFSRRCQNQLGMSFSEWRQRLRFLHAVSLLEQGKSVQNVALDLGYSSASAFIVMFQQQSGITPERYRRRAFLNI